jgi:hypothetical protein
MALRITSRGKAVIGAALVVACLTGYAATANVERIESAHSTHTEAATPDWTVAPCTVDFRPGMTKTITLPAYTMTDRCVQPDGSISISDTFKVVEVFPN